MAPALRFACNDDTVITGMKAACGWNPGADRGGLFLLLQGSSKSVEYLGADNQV